MERRRTILLYKHYFTMFYAPLSIGVRNKIKYVFKILEGEDNIPAKFFKHIEKGLYEIRIEYEGNIYRIFCCLDEGQIIVLFNGFQKKTQKTPRKELDLAIKIMKEYFKEKEGNYERNIFK